MPDIMIGDTLADPDHAHALPRITVDEPAISVTIGTNTSPLAGKVSGHKLTARMVRNRLDTELVGNVSIRVVDIGRPDAWEVQGRGELALAVLVEQMRREGFELTVGKPQVVTKTIDGKLHEPFEAHDHRLPRGVRRRDHAADGRPQGPDGGDDQPRRGLGPDGLHRAQPRADRLPHRLPHRDARHRHRQRGVRRLSAVGGGDPLPALRLAGVRPDRHHHAVRADSVGRPRQLLRRAGRGHLRGTGRRHQPACRRISTSTSPGRRS